MPGLTESAPPPLRIVVVRHGETEWSAALKHTSLTDLPLTPSGKKRASALASQLQGPFANVLCSPMLRARLTAELAGFPRPELDPDLLEWNYGDYEGLTTEEIHARNPDWSLWRDGCPGGETPDQVGTRADRVIAYLRTSGGENLLFAHGHILRVLTARWLDLPPAAGARFAFAAGAVGVLGFERETEVIERWDAG